MAAEGEGGETKTFEGSTSVLVKFNEDRANPDCFEVQTKEIAAGPGECVIQVLACGVNVSDVKLCKGLMPRQCPLVTGRDFCGVVMTGEHAGKKVYGTHGRSDVGSHTQYMTLAEDCLVPKPSTLSDEQAGTLGVPYVTAYEMVKNKCAVKKGDVVVIQGSTGMVGQAATQLSKLFGATTIALGRRQVPLPYGADHYFCTKDITQEQLVEQVSQISGKAGCDVFIDTVGGPSTSLGLDILGNDGRLATIATPTPNAEISINMFQFYRRGISLYGINSLLFSNRWCSQILSELNPHFESGVLKPFLINPTRYALSESDRAINAVAKGTSSRVAILPWPPQ